MLPAAKPALAGGGEWSNPSGGAWNSGGNWNSTVPPNSSDDVGFHLDSAYFVFFPGDAAARDINFGNGTVTFNLSGFTLSGSNILTVGDTSGSTAFVQISNGTVEMPGSAPNIIGAQGATAAMSLSNATLVTNSSMRIGSNGGQAGVVASGSTSQFLIGDTFYIGNTGQDTGVGFVPSVGALQLSAGAMAGSLLDIRIGTDGGQGAVSISGTNTTLTSTSALLYVGRGGYASGAGQWSSQGTLNVSAGALATSDSAMFIGTGGGRGYVSLDGANSRMISGNQLTVGDWGLFYNNDNSFTPSSGTLVITNSARAISNTWSFVGTTGADGFVDINGGRLDVGDSLFIGQSTASNGQPGGQVYAGQGTVLVRGGGVLATNSTEIGTLGGIGQLSVTGAGSVWDNTAAAYVGNGNFGFSPGTGILSITDGASAFIGGTLRVYSTGTLVLGSGGNLDVQTLDLTGSTSHFAWTGGTLRIKTATAASDDAVTLAVPATGTIGGWGAIYRPVDLSAGNNAINPGIASDYGTLTFVAHNLTLASTTTVEIALGGTGLSPGVAGNDYDQLAITGPGISLNLNGGKLTLMSMSGVVTGQAYTIATALGGSSITGAFQGLESELITHAQGAMQFTINYEPTFVRITFTAVPEPTGLALIALGLPILAKRRRRG